LRVSSLLVLAAAAAVASAATHEVQVISFRFQPDTLTVQPGDTVRWRNMGGDHNVLADDESFGSGAPSSSSWTYSHTFETAGSEYFYYCQPHGGPGGAGMSGKIIVQGTTPPAFAINYGIGGTWYNPATSGQGFLIEVVPSANSMALGWFTWSTTAGQHDWLSAFGPISGDSATVNLSRSTGGRFNDPAPIASSIVGTATFKFTSCDAGTVTFNRTDNGTSGVIPIRRLTPTPAACTTPAGAGR
jgi:plastocyanin